MDVTEFLETCGGTKERTRHEYGRVLRQLEGAKDGIGKPLETITATDAKAIAKKLHPRRCGPQYARVLKVYLRAAGRLDLLPFLRMKQRTAKLTANELLTLDEINAMMKAAESARDRAFLTLLWETGERVGAICALNVGDLMEKPANGGPGALIVTFTRTKADRSHQGLIPEKSGGYRFVKDWVAVHPRPSDAKAPLFFSRSAERWTERGAYHMVRKTAKRAGVTKHVHPHLFRHSRATDLLRRGVPATSVKKLLGWAPDSPLLDRLYGHLTDTDAQNDLLRASGVEIPKVEYGELLYDPRELRAVEPIPSPPGTVDPYAKVAAALTEIRDALAPIVGGPAAARFGAALEEIVHR